MNEFERGMGKSLDTSYFEQLGGTRHDYLKQITKDRLSYLMGYRSGLCKVEIPDASSFLKISKIGANGMAYLEAYYDYMGELSSVGIWFRRICDCTDFRGENEPDQALMDAYAELCDSGSDYLFEADMRQGVLSLYLCNEDSESEYIDQIKEHGDCPLPDNGEIIVSSREITDESIPFVEFYCKQSDNVLSLGFMVNENSIPEVNFSTVVDFETLGIKSKPEVLRKVLDKVFVAA